MSLESERRAIGTRLTASRSAIRESVRASRASTFKRDLNALESSGRKQVKLSETEVRGARPATSGTGTWIPPSSQNTGGGVASPLVEQTRVEGGNTVPDRAYHAEVALISSDGLFTYVVKPLQTLNFTDANAAESVVQLAAPSVPVTP